MQNWISILLRRNKSIHTFSRDLKLSFRIQNATFVPNRSVSLETVQRPFAGIYLAQVWGDLSEHRATVANCHLPLNQVVGIVPEGWSDEIMAGAAGIHGNHDIRLNVGIKHNVDKYKIVPCCHPAC